MKKNIVVCAVACTFPGIEKVLGRDSVIVEPGCSKKVKVGKLERVQDDRYQDPLV